MNALNVQSPAKINLFLDVLGKRPDGYHDLYTLFERINLCDTLSLRNTDSSTITVSCNNPCVPCDASNLASRAAFLLQKQCHVKKGVAIHINKRIPVAAGLAGGSSNAASVLLGLNRLWGLKLNKTQLMRAGRQLGSDVGFFLSDTSFAIGTGRGERLQKAGFMKPLWHVIVIPHKKLSTPAIYNAWDAKHLSSKQAKKAKKVLRTNILTKARDNVNMLTCALRNSNLSQAGKHILNTLESPAVRLCPSISHIKRLLNTFGIEACGLSGSGPAVFGLVNSRKEATTVAKKIVRMRKSWQVFAVRTL